MTAPETAPHIDVVGGRPEDAALTVSSTKERVVPFAVAALVCLVAVMTITPAARQRSKVKRRPSQPRAPGAERSSLGVRRRRLTVATISIAPTSASLPRSLRP